MTKIGIALVLVAIGIIISMQQKASKSQVAPVITSAQQADLAQNFSSKPSVSDAQAFLDIAKAKASNNPFAYVPIQTNSSTGAGGIKVTLGTPNIYVDTQSKAYLDAQINARQGITPAQATYMKSLISPEGTLIPVQQTDAQFLANIQGSPFILMPSGTPISGVRIAQSYT